MAVRTKPAKREQASRQVKPLIKQKVLGTRIRGEMRPTAKCDDLCALSAFQAWHQVDLTPSYNWEVSFTNDLPKGRRVVIELVTAQILVPAGEMARLRMFTGLGGWAGNFDLAVTPQGIVNGQAVYVASQALRAYTDGFLSFNINRDNPFTNGEALVCVSGYVIS